MVAAVELCGELEKNKEGEHCADYGLVVGEY